MKGTMGATTQEAAQAIAQANKLMPTTEEAVKTIKQNVEAINKMQGMAGF